MRTFLICDLKLKDGTMYQNGSMFNVVPSATNPNSGADCTDDKGRIVKLRYTSLPHYFADFVSTTIEELEDEVMDCGSSTTPTGACTEPDGHDEYGFPSWLIIYGFI